MTSPERRARLMGGFDEVSGAGLRDSEPATTAEIVHEAWRGWNAHRGLLLAAGLAFYGALSASPLIVIVSAASRHLAGTSVSPQQVFDPIAAIVGSRAAVTVAETVAHSPASRGGSWVLQIVGLAVSLFAGAGLFVQFRAVSDIMMDSPGPESAREGARDLSTGLAAAAVIGVVAAIHALLRRLTGAMPPVVQPAANVVIVLITIIAIVSLVPVAYRYLARHRLPWAAAVRGAVVAVVIGAIATVFARLYFASGLAATVYGPAASIFVALFWLLLMSCGAVAGAEVALVWQRLRISHHRD